MAAITPITEQTPDVFSCDFKEDMVSYLVKHYGFFSKEGEPLGTVQVNRTWFTWPYAFGSINPLCLRTWYVLKDGNGEIKGMAAQTWLSLLPCLPGINWVMTKVFGDLKYSADYTIWNGAGQQVGYIDGRMISFGIQFDLQDRYGDIVANIRVGSDYRSANIYRKASEGKIGEIKIDCETRERGDYKISCLKKGVDLRTLKLFNAIAVDQALIAIETAAEATCGVDAA